jgi:hypothetical protein
MRPRDSLRVGDGVAMSAHLIAIAKNQERFFGPKYEELPKKKLTSLKKMVRLGERGRPEVFGGERSRFHEGS